MKSTLKHFRKIAFLLFFICLSGYSQTPEGFNYQATLRNELGNLITNQNVSIRTNILQNSQTSAPIYTETHNVSADNFGQINLTIGSGTPSLGTFSNINWSNGTYYLNIELNVNGNYVTMGITQLFSVPYALYAKSSSFSLPSGTNVGDVLSWNGTNWVSTPSNNTNPSSLPIVATLSANSISGFGATCGGAIANEGASNILSKGVCWNTSPNPTTSNNLTSDGAGNMDFTSTVTNLLPGTIYFYRAYATNGAGTGYGATYSFTTIGLPVVTTNPLTSVTNSGVQSGGLISSDGGSPITARGVVWDTNPNPTVSLTTKTIDGTGLGNFNSIVSELTYNTSYYIRAYATNEAGTSYGAEQQFTTVNFFSPNLEFTFNYNQPLAVPGTSTGQVTLYNINVNGLNYDMDYFVLDAQFNNTGLYEAASGAEPEHLTISDIATNTDGSPNTNYLADGTYYIFYNLYSAAAIATIPNFSHINVPTTVDYVRQGGNLSGTFVQESAFVPTTAAAEGDSNFVLSFTKLNGVYTLNNSVPEVIASGRFSNNIKNRIVQARKNRRKL